MGIKPNARMMFINIVSMQRPSLELANFDNRPILKRGQTWLQRNIRKGSCIALDLDYVLV